MTKLLYVTANPKPTELSYSLRLGERFLAVVREVHPEVEIEERHLYSSPPPLIDGAVLQSWGKQAAGTPLEATEQQTIDELDRIIEQFLAADIVVFALPMWNFGYPPLLKAYIDSIVIAGKSFKYTETMPMPLAPGKHVVVLEARGSVYTGTFIESFEHTTSYLKTVMSFLGNTLEVVVAEGLAVDPAAAESIYEQTVPKAEAVARALLDSAAATKQASAAAV